MLKQRIASGIMLTVVIVAVLLLAIPFTIFVNYCLY